MTTDGGSAFRQPKSCRDSPFPQNISLSRAATGIQSSAGDKGLKLDGLEKLEFDDDSGSRSAPD